MIHQKIEGEKTKILKNTTTEKRRHRKLHRQNFRSKKCGHQKIYLKSNFSIVYIQECSYTVISIQNTPHLCIAYLIGLCYQMLIAVDA